LLLILQSVGVIKFHAGSTALVVDSDVKEAVEQGLPLTEKSMDKLESQGKLEIVRTVRASQAPSGIHNPPPVAVMGESGRTVELPQGMTTTPVTSPDGRILYWQARLGEKVGYYSNHEGHPYQYIGETPPKIARLTPEHPGLTRDPRDPDPNVNPVLPSGVGGPVDPDQYAGGEHYPDDYPRDNPLLPKPLPDINPPLPVVKQPGTIEPDNTTT
jgi:hypothetical protein